MKKTLLAVLLIVPSLLIGANTYKVRIDHAANAAGAELPTGEYSVRLDGENAIFVKAHTKEVSIHAKVENGNKKFDYTLVEYSHRDGKDIVTAIHLGGSKITLEFQN